MFAVIAYALVLPCVLTRVPNIGEDSPNDVFCQGESLLQLSWGPTSEVRVGTNRFHPFEFETHAPRYERLDEEASNLGVGERTMVDADVDTILGNGVRMKSGLESDLHFTQLQRSHNAREARELSDNIRQSMLFQHSDYFRNNTPHIDAPRRNVHSVNRGPALAVTDDSDSDTFITSAWVKVPSIGMHLNTGTAALRNNLNPFDVMAIAGFVIIFGLILLCLARISHVEAYGDQRVFRKESKGKNVQFAVEHSTEKERAGNPHPSNMERWHCEYPSQATVDQLKKVAHGSNASIQKLPSIQRLHGQIKSPWSAPLHASDYVCPSLVVPFASECTVLMPRLRSTSTELFVHDLAGERLLQVEVTVPDCRLAKGSQQLPAVILHTCRGHKQKMAHIQMQPCVQEAQNGDCALIFRVGGQFFGSLRVNKRLGCVNEYSLARDQQTAYWTFQGDLEKLTMKVLSEHREIVADCCLVNKVGFDSSDSYLRIHAVGNVDVGLLLLVLVSIQMSESSA